MKNSLNTKYAARLACVLLCMAWAFSVSADPEPVKGVTITKGAIYRSTLGRSGVFKKSGVAKAPMVKWTAEVGGKVMSSPVVCEDALYIGGKEAFYAISTEDGTIRWTFSVKGDVKSSACVANDTVLFQANSTVFALEALTGEKKWSYKARKEAAGNHISPAVAYGVVYTAVGREVVALDFTSGKQIFKLKDMSPQEFCSLAFGKDEFYAVSKLEWGYGHAFDYATSEFIWKTTGPFENGAGVYFYKTPAVSKEGNVYYNTTRGVRKFHPEKGRTDKAHVRNRLWFCCLLDKDVEDNEFLAQTSPSVWNGQVFAGRLDGKFAAINDADGKINWQKQCTDSVASDPSIATASGIVYFGCNDKNLYALDAATGEEKWKFETGGEIFSSPWIEDGAVYIASYDGKVYALTE